MFHSYIAHLHNTVYILLYSFCTVKAINAISFPIDVYADIIFLEGNDIPKEISLPKVVGKKLMLHQSEVRCYQWIFAIVYNLWKTLQKSDQFLWKVDKLSKTDPGDGISIILRDVVKPLDKYV